MKEEDLHTVSLFAPSTLALSAVSFSLFSLPYPALWFFNSLNSHNLKLKYILKYGYLSNTSISSLV